MFNIIPPFFFLSLSTYLRADYHYSFSVLRCRYKLINLRARFLCIMARSAGTLCSRMYRRRAPGRPTLAYPLASIVRSCPAAIPVHEYRYVPAHTLCVLIHNVRRRLACPADVDVIIMRPKNTGDTLSVMALG